MLMSSVLLPSKIHAANLEAIEFLQPQTYTRCRFGPLITSMHPSLNFYFKIDSTHKMIHCFKSELLCINILSFLGLFLVLFLQPKEVFMMKIFHFQQAILIFSGVDVHFEGFRIWVWSSDGRKSCPSGIWSFGLLIQVLEKLNVMDPQIGCRKHSGWQSMDPVLAQVIRSPSQTPVERNWLLVRHNRISDTHQLDINTAECCPTIGSKEEKIDRSPKMKILLTPGGDMWVNPLRYCFFHLEMIALTVKTSSLDSSVSKLYGNEIDEDLYAAIGKKLICIFALAVLFSETFVLPQNQMKSAHVSRGCNSIFPSELALGENWPIQYPWKYFYDPLTVPSSSIKNCVLNSSKTRRWTSSASPIIERENGHATEAFFSYSAWVWRSLKAASEQRARAVVAFMKDIYSSEKPHIFQYSCDRENCDQSRICTWNCGDRFAKESSIDLSLAGYCPCATARWFLCYQNSGIWILSNWWETWGWLKFFNR